MSDAATIGVLIAFGFIAGIGITTVGPGGVLATAALVLFTDLSPAGIAGTALVTNIATGVVGSAAYRRSGQLREPLTRRLALLLSTTAVISAPIGVLLNLALPSSLFPILLSGLVLLTALLVLRRGRQRTEAHPRHGAGVLIAAGLVVAVASGMFGVGGPLLTVPLLVAMGTPMLPAVAAAQVQSIVISAVGTAGYLSQGAVDWALAGIVGVPELIGVLVGWWIARRVPGRVLTRVMIVALIAVAIFLPLRGFA